MSMQPHHFRVIAKLISAVFVLAISGCDRAWQYEGIPNEQVGTLHTQVSQAYDESGSEIKFRNIIIACALGHEPAIGINTGPLQMERRGVGASLHKVRMSFDDSPPEYFNLVGSSTIGMGDVDTVLSISGRKMIIEKMLNANNLSIQVQTENEFTNMEFNIEGLDKALIELHEKGCPRSGILDW